MTQFINKVNRVVAYTFDKQCIVYDGQLPWHISEDMKHFTPLHI